MPFEGEIPGFDKPDNDNQPSLPQLPIPDPNTQPSSTKSSDPTVETGGIEPDINPPGEWPASTDDEKMDKESVCGENLHIFDVFVMVRAEQATSQKVVQCWKAYSSYRKQMAMRL